MRGQQQILSFGIGLGIILTMYYERLGNDEVVYSAVDDQHMLAALKLMHSKGVLDREIKPANVVRCRVETPGEEPDNDNYPLRSLGVSMFEMVSASLPFQAESEMLWRIVIAGSMAEQAPSVLDRRGGSRSTETWRR